MSTTSLFRSAGFRAALLCGFLTACGGGGDAPAIPEPADPPAPPVVVPDPTLPSSAYLLHTDKVEFCQVASNGMLVDCVDAQASGFSESYGMTIAGSHLYLETFTSGDADSKITHCSVGADGGVSGCSDAGQTGYFPVGLAVRGSTLYIGDGQSPLVRMCQIQASGSLVDCADALFPAALASKVNDIQIVDTRAYVLHNEDNAVSKCTVMSDGSFASCEDAGASGLDGPMGFTINGNHMHIANRWSNSITRCVIALDGSLTDCRDAGASGLIEPTHLAFRGSNVYITADQTTGIIRCAAGSDGLLTGCTSISEPQALQRILFK